MSIQELIDKMKKAESFLLTFIENVFNDEENYNNLIDNITKLNISSNKYEMKIFLYILNQVSNNHYRNPNFFYKIEKIIKNFQYLIQQYYPNWEIFKIFKENKRILLFLIEENIINFDEEIFHEIIDIRYNKRFYKEYFLPEIKAFIEKSEPLNQKKYNSEELQKMYKLIKKYIDEDFKDFDKWRKNGENDSKICQLIQKDSIDDFITFVNRKNYSLNNSIEPSIFETNPFLIEQKKDISLIEYAVFFGSVQIFKYLYKNNVKLTKSLLSFAVHGQDEEIILIIEENTKSEFQNGSFNDLILPYITCMRECIRCHHNDVANYITQNHINIFNSEFDYVEFFTEISLIFYNFILLPEKNQDYQIMFYYACENDYYAIVEILLNTKEIDLNFKVIMTHNFL